MLIPRNLPSCFWVVAEFADKSVWLYSPRESKKAALSESAQLRDQSTTWLEVPSRIYVEADSFELHARQRPTPSGLPCSMTARWHWLRRNRNILTSHVTSRPCRVLVSSKQPGPRQASDLKAHRIGGRAVLPMGVPWPTGVVESYAGGTLDRIEVPLSYLGTYDLRGAFKYQRFPSAVSFFVCTYDEFSHNFSQFANATSPAGVVVPIFRHQHLQLVSAPAKELELPRHHVAEQKMPDLPAAETSNEHAWKMARKKSRSDARVVAAYAEIERLEPGTSDWIHLRQSKIGGHVSFIQNDLVVARNRANRNIRWQVIGSYSGNAIYLGDSGTLYILAGWDRKGELWHWHCEWQCH